MSKDPKIVAMDRQVLNLSADRAQMDAFCWANYPLKPIPARLAASAATDG